MAATRLKSKEEASKLERPESYEDHVHEKKSGWIKYTEINKGMEVSL